MLEHPLLTNQLKSHTDTHTKSLHLGEISPFHFPRNFLKLNRQNTVEDKALIR